MAPGLRRLAVALTTAALLLTVAVSAVLVLQSSGQTSAVGSDTPAATPGDGDWTASWGAALTGPDTEGRSVTGFDDVTLRQVVHLSLGGDVLRLRLSNVHGERPLSVGAVTLAPHDGRPGTPEVDADRLVRATFAGRAGTLVPVGGTLASDPIALEVPDDSDLVVNVHVARASGPTTWQASALATSYVADGDATLAGGEAFTELDTSRYYLAGVDVVDEASDGTVVFVGDSLTAGADSTLDADRRFPDLVADRLFAAAGRGGSAATGRCGVVNAGIGGNRLLSGSGISGDALVDRFARDVLDVPGVRTVVVLAGINDIGAAGDDLDPAALMAGHRALVDAAHEAGVRVVGATLLPYGGAGYATVGGERTRRAVNRWLMTSGTHDAVVDLDAAVRDPDRPYRLWPSYDSGDHLHPDDAGYGAMADAVDLTSIC
ncbi:SGNH/GDSL hydrolase family protein [Nocardioides lentus]|uniref:SGNH/GDSL hydrolase family protein n=1 Tax=Nocardioides lentus TaxID=338077 RepID=A0ABP5B4U6_9ACTN